MFQDLSVDACQTNNVICARFKGTIYQLWMLLQRCNEGAALLPPGLKLFTASCSCSTCISKCTNVGLFYLVAQLSVNLSKYYFINLVVAL